MVTRGIASVTHDFLRSIAVSFAVVFLVVAIFLRSWRLTLLSVLPNLIPIAVAAGVMGFWGIHLRVGTAIILPVSLGIAVDATVHYLARAREEAGTAADATTAAVRALLGVGRGMVFSGVALVAGFLCLLLPDLRVFHDVAILGVTALAAATAADLLVLPALFATFGWRAPVRDVRADAGVTAPASAPFGGDVVLVFTQVARATAAPEEHAATLEQSKVDAADAEAR
jgi:predicted RND superfamily exporter protein